MDPEQKLQHLAKSHDIGLEYRKRVLEEVFLFDIEQSSAGDEILRLVGAVPSVHVSIEAAAPLASISVH